MRLVDGARPSCRRTTPCAMLRSKAFVRPSTRPEGPRIAEGPEVKARAAGHAVGRDLRQHVLAVPNQISNEPPSDDQEFDPAGGRMGPQSHRGGAAVRRAGGPSPDLDTRQRRRP